ncbi:curli-like amyloid fiber formation chaperone CsgH [Microbaculum marinum]|uniref:Curli-like amyloid fiber formation chaperone CsgH n=2 Tax=Microbaculum marinum TaxID=1764581 RepID=A0AAW9RWV5_9HYPH
MTRNHKRFAARILPVVLGLGVIGVGVGTVRTTPASAGSAPVSCEIQAARAGSMIALSGVVHSSASVEGSYRLSVVSSGGGGSSNINQGGGFTIGSDGSATLGQVTLGNSGAVYDARLQVTVSGKTYSCDQRIDGNI